MKQRGDSSRHQRAYRNLVYFNEQMHHVGNHGLTFTLERRLHVR